MSPTEPLRSKHYAARDPCSEPPVVHHITWQPQDDHISVGLRNMHARDPHVNALHYAT